MARASCNIAAAANVIIDISPKIMLVPMFITIAIPIVIKKINGSMYDFVVNNKIIKK